MNSRILCAPDFAIPARRDFQTILKSRELQLAACNKSFTVIGHGSVGAKAEQLMQKAWAIEQAGFVMNPRVVFAMGFFDAFRERNGINEAIKRGAAPREIRDLIRNGKFSADETQVFIDEIAKRFRGKVIAVRSSAHGDCRGTGIYSSEFCLSKNIGGISKTVKEVLCSEFSKNAIAYRKDLGHPAGMAVIIEPIFDGEAFEPRYAEAREMLIAPQYSGLAYTSTSWGKGRIQFVAGMPTVAVNGGGFIAEEGCADTLEDILWEINDIYKTRERDHRAAHENLLMKMLDWKRGTGISTLTGHEYELDVNRRSLHGLSVGWLFERLKALEQLLGKPQYVEFALADRGGKPAAAILQIANVELSRDFYEFSETRNIMARSNLVVGSGRRVCDGLVFVCNPDDRYPLSEYNEKHSNYIVLYAGRLTSNIMWHGKINYSDLSNSAVVVEKYEMMHTCHPVAHFEGMIQQSGKLFMVVGNIDWDKLEGSKREIHVGDASLIIYDAKFRVTASERQQKGIIELIEG